MATSTYQPLATPHRNRVLAQLRSLSTTATTESRVDEDTNNLGQIVINFPAMPETIELARRANYKNMVPTQATPDGMHFYQNTDPLKIPIKFTAHSFDADFTHKDGPVALLQMAARLHALTLPIFNPSSSMGGIMGTAPAAAPVPPAGGAQKSEDKQAGTAAKPQNVGLTSLAGATVNTNDQSVYFPVPCFLNIMMAKWGPGAGVAYGINCIGFVEEVRVTLHGPWLQGNSGGSSLDDLRNLPSSVDYEFTFVHQPGYTNKFLGGTIGTDSVTSSSAGSAFALQAFANDIYQRLYNQSNLDKLTIARGKTFNTNAVNAMGNLV